MNFFFELKLNLIGSNGYIVVGIIVTDIPTDEAGMPILRNFFIKCSVFTSRYPTCLATVETGQWSNAPKIINTLIGINPNLFLPFKIEYSCLLFIALLMVDCDVLFNPTIINGSVLKENG